MRMLITLGVNCCIPADVTVAGTVTREVTGKSVSVYPNSGEGWGDQRHQRIGPSRFVGDFAHQWVKAGDRIVGGYYQVRPADIATSRSALVSGCTRSRPTSL